MEGTTGRTQDAHDILRIGIFTRFERSLLRSEDLQRAFVQRICNLNSTLHVTHWYLLHDPAMKPGRPKSL